MTQREIIDAYNATDVLYKMRLPVRDAYNVFRLRKRLEPHYIFEMERERKMLEDLNGKIEPDGRITFQDMESALKFQDALIEADNMDVEEEIEPIHMQMDALGTEQITPQDMEHLDGFIVFE